jgi:DNA-binding NtrC family response regulator
MLPVRRTDSLHVLIVDDELLVRWALASMLGQHGCTVVDRADARSATRTVTESPGAFDLILLDYRLSDSDDLTLLARLKRLAPTTTVLMMSAHMSRDDQDEAMRLGAAAFVPKPFDLDDVWTLIQNVRSH